MRDFPGCSMVKTLCFLCRGPGSSPGRGTRTHMLCCSGKKKSQTKSTELLQKILLVYVTFLIFKEHLQIAGKRQILDKNGQKIQFATSEKERSKLPISKQEKLPHYQLLRKIKSMFFTIRLIKE